MSIITGKGLVTKPDEKKKEPEPIEQPAKKVTNTLTASMVGSEVTQDLELVSMREGSEGALNMTFNRSLTQMKQTSVARANLPVTQGRATYIKESDQKNQLNQTLPVARRGTVVKKDAGDQVEYEIGEFQAGDTILDTCSSAREQKKDVKIKRRMTVDYAKAREAGQVAAHLLKPGAPGLNTTTYRRRNIMQSKKDLIALLREIN